MLRLDLSALKRLRVVSQGSERVRVRYDYDELNRLKEVRVDLFNPGDLAADSAVDPDGNSGLYVTTYGYHGSSSRVASITQSDGTSVQFTYALVGDAYRVSSVSRAVGGTPASRVSTFSYDLAARRTDVQDALGGITRYTYDEQSRLIQVEPPTVDGVRSLTSYSYDLQGNIAQVSTRVGSDQSRTISYQYGADGNLEEVRDQLGNTQRRSYNSAGQLLTETAFLTPDPDGAGSGQPSQPQVTNYIYDNEQHLRFLVTAEGRVTQYLYNALGQQTDVIQYTGLRYSGSGYTEADLANWAAVLSDKTKAQRTTYTYDFRGQVSSARRFGTLTTAGAGVVDSNASTTYFFYDASGRLLKSIDPRGGQGANAGDPFVTSFAYDGLHRIKHSIDSSGQITKTTYTNVTKTVSGQSIGSEVLVESPNGLRTTSFYSLAGDLIQKIQVKTATDTSSVALSSRTTNYRYDALGRLRMVTDPAGQRTYILYDARGWKEADIGAEGTLVEYFYNDAGQVTGILRHATPLTANQLNTLVDGNGRPTNTTLDTILGRTSSALNVLPFVDLNGGGAGIDYTATVSSGAAIAAVNATALTLGDGGDNGGKLLSATAFIVNAANGASELLSIASLPAGMTATYDAARNLLTLRATNNEPLEATQFLQALRSLRYQNTATGRIPGERHIQIVVNDGTDFSAIATSRLTVQAVAPSVDLNGSTSGTGFAATYTEDGLAVSIVDSLTLTVSDPDSAVLTGGTVRITNLQNAGSELLSVDVASTGIAASYNGSTGVLTLSGSSSVANYQQVLRTLKYQNTSQAPTAGNRLVDVTVTDGALTSAVVTSTVTVVAVNDAPVIGSASTSATYVEDAEPVVVVNAGLTLTDIDNANLTGATISLGSRPDGALEILSIDVGSTGITASYNSSTGVLTLTGSRSKADYQTVLRTLKYQNDSEDPTSGSRTITLRVTDGTTNSATVNTSVSVTPVNDAPVISGASTSASYTEDAAPVVVVNAGLTLTDVDSPMLTGATVTFASRPNGTSEVLSVDVGSTGITASFNGSTGELTLSGSSSVANYQQVLRTLKYQNTSQAPSSGTRTLNLSVTDGALTSAIATTSVSVTPVNDAPVIGSASTTATYVENAAPVLVVNTGLTVTDLDHSNIASATISLGSRPDGALEILSVDVGSTGIVASYDGSTGVLTLTGSRSKASYQQVLRTLKYQNDSENPTAGNRTISLTITDNVNPSATVNTSVSVTPVNDLTVIGGAGSGISYTEDAVPVVINPNLTLSDLDHAALTAMRVRIVSAPDGGYELLRVEIGSSGLEYAGYDSATGYYTLTGSASLSAYQDVLRTLTYRNSSQNPTAGDRVIELAVNDGLAWSNSLLTTVTVVPVNDAPVVDMSPDDPSLSSTSVVFPLMGTSVVCAPDLVITDVDSPTLGSATITIENASALDSLSVTTSGTPIVASYNSGTGVLSLVGTATVAQYRQVLSTLTYSYALGGLLFLSQKKIHVAVSDGQATGYVPNITVLTPAQGALQGINGASSQSSGVQSASVQGGSAQLAALASGDLQIGDRLEQRIYDAAGRWVFTLVDDLDSAGTRVRYVTETKYDGANRVVQSIAYNAQLAETVELTETAIRTALNARTTVEKSLDRISQSIYDKDGLLLGLVDAEGGFTELRYDAAGRQTESIRYGKKVTYTGTQSIATLVVQGTPTSGELAADPSLAPQSSYTLYDNKGQIVGRISEERYLTTYQYDSAGNRRSETRYGGQISYSGTEPLDSLTSAAISGTPSGTPASRVRQWDYDALNRVTQETDEQGTVTTYTYNPQSGLLALMTRAAGTPEARTTTHRYDALGRLTETMSGEGSAALAAAGTNTTAQDTAWSQYQTQNVYDLAGRLVKTITPSSTDAAGNAVPHFTVYYYDRQNRLKYAVNAMGEVKGYAYNAFGEVESLTEYYNRLSNPSALSGGDAGGLSVTADTLRDRSVGKTYTLRGQEDVVTDALQFSVDHDYSAFGQLVRRVSEIGTPATPDSRIDTWKYDRRGLATEALRDLGSGRLNLKETYGYDVFGRQINRTDGRLSVWKTGYDKLGRVITTTDPLNGGTVTGYDAFDRVLTQADRLGNVTRYAYSDTERSLTVTTPEGIVTKAVQNRHGQQISVTLENINGPETTTYLYDLDGRLEKVTKPNTGASSTESTTHKYDRAGLLTIVTDGRGVKTTYAYDAANRVMTRIVDPGNTSTVNPDTGQPFLNLTTSYEYDAFGGSIRVKDGRNVITETVFDQRGKSVAVIVDTAGLKLATVYEYDAEGRAILVKEGVQATGSTGSANVPGSWNYSGTALKTTQYVFDAAGRRTQEIVDPGEGRLNITTLYSYDANGNLTRKKDPRTDQTIYTWYTYDANNRLIYTVNALGEVTKNAYDAEGRVTTVTRYYNRLGSTSGFGAVVSSSSVVPTGTALDRITASIYDNNGRLTYQTDARRGLTKYTYDGQGRIKSSTQYATALGSGIALTRAGIDAAVAATDFKNPDTDQTTKYDYDAAGRLIKLTDALSFIEEYGYDKAGNRNSLKNKKGDVWTYVYDGANRLLEERAPQENIYSITASGTASVGAPHYAFKTTQFEYDPLGNLKIRREGYLRRNGIKRLEKRWPRSHRNWKAMCSPSRSNVYG